MFSLCYVFCYVFLPLLFPMCFVGLFLLFYCPYSEVNSCYGKLHLVNIRREFSISERFIHLCTGLKYDGCSVSEVNISVYIRFSLLKFFL